MEPNNPLQQNSSFSPIPLNLPSTPTPPTAGRRSYKLPLIITSVLVLVILSATGLYISRKTIPTQPTDQFFDKYTAIVKGTIAKVDGPNITIKNSKGMVGTYQFSSLVLIHKFPSGSNQATITSDIKQIELNREAVVILELVGNKFKISTINYQNQ